MEQENKEEQCYQVAVRSTDEVPWHLASQNYRLYYDASQLRFVSGKSLLGDNYQEFHLVQNISSVDGSNVDGCLHFAKNLGFLNYAIDQLNVDKVGALIPTGQEWLPTSQLCFSTTTSEYNAPTLIWGREDITTGYATSFVEISEWLSSGKVVSARGEKYVDIGNPCSQFMPSDKGVSVKAKAILQGAFDAETGFMKDILRAKGLIPTIEPYTEMAMASSRRVNIREQVSSEVLEITGEEAIVDWVFLELRDSEIPTNIVASRCALITRDGMIVDVDGSQPVRFDVKEGDYYLAIRHRNHLGIMSAAPLRFTTEEMEDVVDFSLANTKVYGEQSRVAVNGSMCLWAGNADANQYIIFQGGGIASSDGDAMFFEVLQDPDNVNYQYNFIKKGYSASDLNLDGEVRYQGLSNDRDDFIFFNIIRHEENAKFYTNFYIVEQLPRD